MSRARSFLPSALAWTCLLSAVAVGAYHVAIEVKGLGLPEPMSVWESYYVALSRHWDTLYQRGHYVDSLGMYGPAYPASVRPLLGLGLEPYLAHRLANLLELLAGCGLLAWYLRTRSVRWSVAAPVVSILYCLNAGSYSIMARPDFLLETECLAILILGARMMDRDRERMREAVLLGLLALAAYMTKAYAVIAWGTVAGYGCLVRGWWKSAAVSAAIAVGGVALYARTHYYFWFDTYHFVQAQLAFDKDMFALQTRDFAVLACGLFATCLLAAPWRRDRPGRADYWVVATLAGGLPLLYVGFHAGAYLTYYLHLLLPPLAVLAALRTEAALAGGRRPWVAAFLVANLAVLMVYAPGLPDRDRGWDSLRADALNQRGPVLASWVLEPLVSERPGTTLSSDGMTPLILGVPGWLHGAYPTLLSARAEVGDYWQAMEDRLSGPGRPAAIYLEGIVESMTPADYLFLKRNQPDALLVPFASARSPDSIFIPREQLGRFHALILTHYTPQAYLTIQPYYLATNVRRELAGKEYSGVLKLVPTP